MSEETTATVQVEKKPEEVYLNWKAPSRPFVKREVNYFKRAGLILFILCLLFIFFKQFLMVAVLLALAFVGYVLATVEPEEIEHRITSQGITTGGKSYLWEELDAFYFSQRAGKEVLNVETTDKFLKILMLLLDGVDKEAVKNLLLKHLSFREVAPLSSLDKLSEMASRFLSLD